MGNPQTTKDRPGALAFIVAQQEEPATATAYVGALDENLVTDLEGLEQPWMDTLRVVENVDGTITGAALVEWDLEVSIAWIYGPWTTPETWDRDAAALLASVVDQTPVGRQQMYGDVENTRMAELAERLGWSPNDADIIFEANRVGQARVDREGVRPRWRTSPRSPCSTRLPSPEPMPLRGSFSSWTVTSPRWFLQMMTG